MENPKSARSKLLEMASDGGKDFESYLTESAKSLLLRKSQNEFGTLLLHTLVSKGYTQASFAERMGMSRQQINSVIKGKENLTLATIQRIEEALGVKLHQFCIQELPQEQESFKVSIKSAVFTVCSNILCESQLPFPSDKSIGKTFSMAIHKDGAALFQTNNNKQLAAAAYYASLNC